MWGFLGRIEDKPKIQYELAKRFGLSWVPVDESVHQERADRENSMIAAARAGDIEVEMSEKTVAPLLKGIFYAKTGQSGEVEILSNDQYFKYDDHMIHYDSHIRLILSAEFKNWPAPNQVILINHTDMHHFANQAAAMQQAMAQQQAQSPASPRQPGPTNTPNMPAQETMI